MHHHLLMVHLSLWDDLFQRESKMLLFFRRKTNIIHFHLTIFDVAKQIGVVAVNKIWEVDYLVRLLISEFM